MDSKDSAVYSVNASAPAGGGITSASLTMDSVEVRSRGEKAKSRTRRRKGTSSMPHQQELGTEYGETLSSQVTNTEFERATEAPCEMHLIKYDSLVALKKAGIMNKRPSEQQKPQAFPESPGVEQGFCDPPAKRRFR